MQYTTNFNLKKPEGTDIYNIGNENDNMDVIDGALGKSFSTDDAASIDIADADYIPFVDTSASEKKKMLLSTARKDVRARIAESVSNDVIETIGSTALNSYSIGQYFLGNDGYYYAATSAITGGSTVLNSGVSGNCSKTSIAAGMNSLASQISNLSYDLSNMMRIRDIIFTPSGTVAAGGVSDINLSVPLTGYTLAGIITVRLNAGGGCCLVSFLTNNVNNSADIFIRVRNTGITDWTPTQSWRVRALYIKSDLLTVMSDLVL